MRLVSPFQVHDAIKSKIFCFFLVLPNLTTWKKISF